MPRGRAASAQAHGGVSRGGLLRARLTEGTHMLRRTFVALALGLTLLLPFSGSAAAAERISITPDMGHQDDTFTLTGSGLQPGLALDINFISPDGQVFSTVFKDKVVVVGADGRFSFAVLPSRDFAGAQAGVWTVQVCAAGTDDCAQGDFSIDA